MKTWDAGEWAIFLLFVGLAILMVCAGVAFVLDMVVPGTGGIGVQ